MQNQESLIHIQAQESIMKSGYKIYWTDYALNELEKTIEFLEENWIEKEMMLIRLVPQTI